MEEVERCPGLWGNLALVGRVHRCVAKPPVSNVTEVIPNKPDVISNTASNAVSDKAHGQDGDALADPYGPGGITKARHSIQAGTMR